MRKYIALALAWALLVGPAEAQIVSVPSPTTVGTALPGQVPGTATNDNACAGCVGEYVSSSIPIGSAVPLSAATATTIATAPLTAGDWDCSGNIEMNPAGTTVVNRLQAGLNTTTNALPTDPGGGSSVDSSIAAVVGGTGLSTPVGTARFSLAASGSVFLITRVNFTVSTLSAYGFLGCRRAR